MLHHAVPCYIMLCCSMYLGSSTCEVPVPPRNLTWYVPRMYLGCRLIPAYTKKTTKAYVLQGGFEQPILMPQIFHHII